MNKEVVALVAAAVLYTGCGGGGTAGSIDTARTQMLQSLTTKITKGNYVAVARYAYRMRHHRVATYDVSLPGRADMTQYSVSERMDEGRCRMMSIANPKTRVIVRFMQGEKVQIALRTLGFATKKILSKDQFEQGGAR